MDHYDLTGGGNARDDSEYEIESLIDDLGLPRQIIEEDVAKGRLLVYQHNGDSKHYVDHDVFVDYLTTRVGELPAHDRRVFWQAVKKIMLGPTAEAKMDPNELRIVLQAIDREIAKC